MKNNYTVALASGVSAHETETYQQPISAEDDLKALLRHSFATAFERALQVMKKDYEANLMTHE